MLAASRPATSSSRADISPAGKGQEAVHGRGRRGDRHLRCVLARIPARPDDRAGRFQAREAAGDRDVRISGGAETIQEYLDTGLIDEFSITLAPVLFGTGIRLFGHVDPDRLTLNQASTAASTRVTHLTYTAAKR